MQQQDHRPPCPIPPLFIAAHPSQPQRSHRLRRENLSTASGASQARRRGGRPLLARAHPQGPLPPQTTPSSPNRCMNAVLDTSGASKAPLCSPTRKPNLVLALPLGHVCVAAANPGPPQPCLPIFRPRSRPSCCIGLSASPVQHLFPLPPDPVLVPAPPSPPPPPLSSSGSPLPVRRRL